MRLRDRLAQKYVVYTPAGKAVMNEIVDFFKPKIESQEFENWLEEECMRNLQNKELTLTLGFMRYDIACSSIVNTFYICDFKWDKLRGKPLLYRGIDLSPVIELIIQEMCDLFEISLLRLGFWIHKAIRKNSYGGVEYGYTISWVPEETIFKPEEKNELKEGLQEETQ